MTQLGTEECTRSSLALLGHRAILGEVVILRGLGHGTIIGGGLVVSKMVRYSGARSKSVFSCSTVGLNVVRNTSSFYCGRHLPSKIMCFSLCLFLRLAET